MISLTPDELRAFKTPDGVRAAFDATFGNELGEAVERVIPTTDHSAVRSKTRADVVWGGIEAIDEMTTALKVAATRDLLRDTVAAVAAVIDYGRDTVRVTDRDGTAKAIGLAIVHATHARTATLRKELMKQTRGLWFGREIGQDQYEFARAALEGSPAARWGDDQVKRVGEDALQLLEAFFRNVAVVLPGGPSGPVDLQLTVTPDAGVTDVQRANRS